MAPLKAKILISFILLIVLLMLPDEAVSQRRRRGMITSNTAQKDSLQGNDSLKADTVTVHVILNPKDVSGFGLSKISDFMPEDAQTISTGCIRAKSGAVFRFQVSGRCF